jgi:hypothetical protein
MNIKQLCIIFIALTIVEYNIHEIRKIQVDS